MTEPKLSQTAAAGVGRDAAALALRGVLGPMLFAHGWNKVAGPGGLKGTAGWFESLGLRPAAVHARMAAGTEMAAGVGLVLGLANPLPAAAAVGLMTVAARTDHRGKGFFVFKAVGSTPESSPALLWPWPCWATVASPWTACWAAAATVRRKPW
ncbi:DoxX family protein [Streptomyces sp. NBC_00827]|uniref:DoxX family protein n=1 Tax=Streptomyces sp. NBC_00827 TaxID=2903677 RepID=UPI00386A1720|nr:DoxX family protein [Streptomyces sp. NBC_00827]